jgi:proteasome-associated ATPase
MNREEGNQTGVPLLLEQLTTVGEGALGIDEKVKLLQAVRAHSRETGRQADRFLVEQNVNLQAGLAEARENQEKLSSLLEQLTAPPWPTATLLGVAPSDEGDVALILHGGSRRVVRLADSVDPLTLEVGDELLLGNELNVVVGKSPYDFAHSGEIADFDRYMPDGRLVLKWRDEEVIVSPAGRLRQVVLRSGDSIRWDRNAWLAFEKVERSSSSSLFLEESPPDSFDSIGGLDTQIARLQRSLKLHLYHPEVVREFGLRRKGSVLLVGPPGTGKTMVARALANWLGSISRSGRSCFMNVKPGELNSEWYGRSEKNYREAFRVAREVGRQEPEVPVVMFFDEVDSVGSVRGRSLGHVEDRVLTALMAELDGLERRGNILVVAATNRIDTLDPALLRPGRLGDLIVEVPRPNMKAGREIFARYLPAGRPYALARHQLIEMAVSTIYSPNAANELATLTFRDGRRRIVRAGDLITGASIAKIVDDASEIAGMRKAETGEAAIGPDDILTAIADEFESAAKALKPHNCHSYLTDLPQDVDVVKVEPIQRRVARPHRFLNVA